jgi:hypothetical protein
MGWRDQSDVYILTNMHNPSTNRKFCDKHGNAIKKRTIQDYNQHKWYTGKKGTEC